jgi:hypothetical protein
MGFPGEFTRVDRCCRAAKSKTNKMRKLIFGLIARLNDRSILVDLNNSINNDSKQLGDQVEHEYSK